METPEWNKIVELQKKMKKPPIFITVKEEIFRTFWVIEEKNYLKIPGRKINLKVCFLEGNLGDTCVKQMTPSTKKGLRDTLEENIPSFWAGTAKMLILEDQNRIHIQNHLDVKVSLPRSHFNRTLVRNQTGRWFEKKNSIKPTLFQEKEKTEFKRHSKV